MKIQGKTFRKLIGKALSIALVIMLIGSNARYNLILAQEAPPTDPTAGATTAPTDTSVSNTGTQTTSSDSNANTGGDATTPTVTVTPTPTSGDLTATVTPTPDAGVTTDPTVTPAITPTPDPTLSSDTVTPADSSDSGLSVDNTGAVTSSESATSNTGNNTIQSPDNSGGAGTSQSNSSGGGSSGGNNSVTTGNAASVQNVDNSVNTTSVNSQVVYQTINLYIDQNGDIDLSLPSDLAKALVAQNPDAATINAAVASVSNNATSTTDVSGSANTGGNSGSGDNVTIHTGDAITLMSILNRINFVMIDSVVHVVTINIFGNFNGNILLPDLPTAGATTGVCPSCGSTTSVTNNATVNNNVTATADSGNNTVTAGTGTILTGDAAVNVKIINLINTVLYGTSTFQLYILDHGLWNGSFLGWSAGDGTTTASTDIAPGTAGCPTCVTNAQITNTVTLSNTVNALATTGGNSATGNSGSITTGNAYVSADILNFVNTSLIKSFGFFGFINIFGSWTGNVGSKSLLVTPTPAAEATAEDSSSGNGAVREDGGQLAIEETNNVAGYVNPGDTVTFFITLHNPGNGRVFDTNVSLHLFKDGVDMGGTTIPVGNIKIGGTVKVTTGLQLSSNAPGGTYTAHTEATGHVGAGSDTVSAAADSTFDISGAAPGLGSGNGGGTNVVVAGSVPPHVQVLGATTRADDNANILLGLLVLLFLIPEYIFYRATRNRQLFRIIIADDITWRARLRAVTMLLL